MCDSNYFEGRLIGKGAFSNLYEGINKITNEKVALKKIDKNKLLKSQNPDYFINALKKEIENMQLCQCENTVKFYEHYEEENYDIIAMELCDLSLFKYYSTREKFSIEEIFEIYSNLNKAFKIMQEKKVVHRDIKLENILIKFTNKEKTKFQPKLCDFGFSKQIKEIGINTRLGTPVTLAPEVYQGQEYDSKADLWSIGVTLYYCYFKEYPYSYKELPNIIKSNKVPCKKPDNYFLADLIDKLLVVSSKNRITWEEYFNHPFFKVFALKEFNFGFKNDYLKYYKGKYKEDDKNIKNVLIKEMKQNNLKDDFYYNDFSNHNIFSTNINVLKLITPIAFKDEKNKQIIYLVYECDENCIPLGEYCKNHNFEENEIKRFNTDFFDIFKKRCNSANSDIFISIYSFVVYQNGEIKLSDFGLNKKFLSNEEMKIYYAPNEEEMKKSENPSKTCLMNYGITLLKMINNNDDDIFFKNNEFNLNSKRNISEKFKSFLSQCLCNDIENRPNWNDLTNDEFIKGDKTLLNEKQFDFLLNYFLEKYNSISEYYNIFDFNDDNISQNEDFLLLTFYEIKKIKEILYDENSFNKNENQITFITLSKLKDNSDKLISKLNLNSKNCFNMKLISDNLSKEQKNKFYNEMEKIFQKLLNKLIDINKKTNSKKFSIENNEISDDFLENFVKNYRHFDLQDFCLSFINNFNNKNINKETIDYENALIELNFSKYIIEFLLFFKESIKESDEFSFNKKYESNDELLKDINNIFINENKADILISLLHNEFVKIIKDLSNDEQNILVKDNKTSLSQLIHFYPFMLKIIGFVNFNIN